MMKKLKMFLFLCCLAVFLIACNSDKEIIRGINWDMTKDDIVSAENENEDSDEGVDYKETLMYSTAQFEDITAKSLVYSFDDDTGKVNGIVFLFDANKDNFDNLYMKMKSKYGKENEVTSDAEGVTVYRWVHNGSKIALTSADDSAVLGSSLALLFDPENKTAKTEIASEKAVEIEEMPEDTDYRGTYKVLDREDVITEDKVYVNSEYGIFGYNIDKVEQPFENGYYIYASPDENTTGNAYEAKIYDGYIGDFYNGDTSLLGKETCEFVDGNDERFSSIAISPDGKATIKHIYPEDSDTAGDTYEYWINGSSLMLQRTLNRDFVILKEGIFNKKYKKH